MARRRPGPIELVMQDWVKPIELRGSVVRLDPLQKRHAPGLLAAASPDLFQFTPQAPREWSLAGFEADVERINGLENVVGFAVVGAQGGEVIGRTTYMEIRPTARGLEIGRTWISRAHQGTRVNPEMKWLMMRHAFETLGAIRVQFTTGHRNLHSQRAIEKLGAVREGLLRNHLIEPDGRPRDTVIYSVTAAEWPAVSRGLQTRLSSAS
jgi:ribosomal-protein-alanine N-acetyltransferase